MEPKKIDKKTGKNIYEKLQEARVALQKKALKKSGYNKFSNYKYFEQDDFLPEVTNILLEHRLTSIFTLSKEIAKLEIIDFDKPEEPINFSVSLEKIPDNFKLNGCTEVQTIGGMNTYLKRYLYLNALEISENDPIDSREVVAEEKQTPAKKSSGEMSPEQARNWLTKFLQEEKKDAIKAKRTAYRIENNGELTIDDKKELLASIDDVYGTNYKEDFEKKSFLV